jgi:hypothetical protein
MAYDTLDMKEVVKGGRFEAKMFENPSINPLFDLTMSRKNNKNYQSQPRQKLTQSVTN